jgi:heat shock protein HslJ
VDILEDGRVRLTRCNSLSSRVLVRDSKIQIYLQNLNKVNMKVRNKYNVKSALLLWVHALCATSALSVSGCLPIGSANSAPLDVVILTQSRWGDVAALQDRKPVSLDFKDAASAAGNAGCNAYFGKFEIKGESVAFKQIGLTRMLCDPESMDTESRYVNALNSTRSARIEKGILELRDAQGKVLWRFKPLA